MATINHLTPELRRRLGIRVPRRKRLSQDDVRGYALAALYPLRELGRNDRRRVLSQMTKVNNV